MKDRLVTLALAIGALALFYTLMLHRPASPQERVTRPQSTEQGPNGYLALTLWLKAIGLPPLSLRDRFTKLDQQAGVPKTGNVLISSAPHLYPLRDSEVWPLRSWIAEGNTLLVVAGLSDTPEWAMGEGADPAFLRHLESMTGVKFAQLPATAAGNEQAQPESSPAQKDAAAAAKEKPQALVNPFAKLDPPESFEMAPNGPHPLLEGVSSVKALSDFPTAKWQASSSSLSELVLELAREDQAGQPVLWLVPYGHGQIIVSGYGSVFTNRLLGEKDNARLLSNILRWSLAPQGRVVIDDMHQGLVSFYDAQAFFGDKRLHATLWWLLGLWFVFVLGSQRLRASASRWQPVDVTSFVRASGGFMARVLKPATAAQQLFENFFNELRRQTGLQPNGAPVWDWMAERSVVTDRDLARLREWYTRSMRGARVDLPALQNLLTQVRQRLI